MVGNIIMKETILHIFYICKEKGFICLVALIAFLSPIHALLFVTGTAIMADTFTGIWKAKKRGEKITSHKLSGVVTKMFLYQSAIVLFFIIETYILQDFIKLIIDIPLVATKFVSIVLLSIEMKSIHENIQIITGINFIEKATNLVNRVKTMKKDLNKE